jgi:hypothetical protein
VHENRLKKRRKITVNTPFSTDQIDMENISPNIIVVQDSDDEPSMVNSNEIGGNKLKTYSGTAFETSVVIAPESTIKLFPIFYKHHRKSDATAPSVFSNLELNRKSTNELFPMICKVVQNSDATAPSVFSNLQLKRKSKYRNGDNYKSDDDQEAKRPRVEHPEDSLMTFIVSGDALKNLNLEFNLSKTFQVWQQERLVCAMPDWGVNGRIIAGSILDGYELWSVLKKIIEMVDKELGINGPIPDIFSMIYMAVACSKIIGVCVAAQPIVQPKVSCSTKVYPVK